MRQKCLLGPNAQGDDDEAGSRRRRKNVDVEGLHISRNALMDKITLN